jgi:hypothetical protein
VSVADGLTVGGSVNVSGTVTNNTTSSIHVTSIAADTSTFTNGVEITAHPHAGTCAAADFHFSGSLTGGATTLAANGGNRAYTGTLSLDDTAVEQDGCQGASITLHLIAS